MNHLLNSRKRILVTGGAGFIGGALIRNLLLRTGNYIFNLDKMGYASDTKQIEQLFVDSPKLNDRYSFIKVDLSDETLLSECMTDIDPDIIFHLAAESHVDRSIWDPRIFLKSNIVGTFNLLESARKHWEKLSDERKDNFRFHHVSTDEVFGSLGDKGTFSEFTPYAPRSPYSASKASSDHLVQAWHHTFGLPVLITNCSNNFGPWQFPEKLIPVAIMKALDLDQIPMYGNGSNVRDWLFVEDHIEALMLVASSGKVGSSYCIGGHGQKTNYEVLDSICNKLDRLKPWKSPYKKLITAVRDRPGHDFRYAIDSTLISTELGWKPRFSFEEALSLTVEWYVENISWVKYHQKSIKND